MFRKCNKNGSWFLSTLTAVASLLVQGPIARDAEASVKLTIAYSNFPPIAGARPGYPEEQGLLIDFYDQVLPQLGYDVHLTQLPAARIRHLMEKGDHVDLYSCSDISRKRRPLYAFGPKFIALNILLYQIASVPALNSYKDLKDETVLKQLGFNPLKKLLDPSNRYMEVSYTSLAEMFARRRSDYLIGFRERLTFLFSEQPNMPDYRTYHVRSFAAHLCLNRRFENAEQRVLDIHRALIAYQDTEDGKALIMRYMFDGRFGSD